MQVATPPVPSIVHVYPLDHIAIRWPAFAERLDHSVRWIYGCADTRLLDLQRALDRAMEVRS